MSVEQLEQDLIRLAEIKKQLEAYDELKKEEAEVREAVLMGMQALKSKRTEPINGYYAIRAERKSLVVSNPNAVEDWLNKNGYDASEYKRLDTTMIKSLADQVMKRDGEKLPGVEVELTENVTIRKAE